MSTNVYVLCFIFKFGYGCIPTESPDDRPDIPGVFPYTTSSTTITITDPVTATISTSSPTTTSSTTTTTTTTTSTTTTTTTTTAYYCDPEWVFFTVPTGETYCYYISTTAANYETSEADCMSRFPGGHLASVHSKEEQDFIFNNLILPLMPNNNIYTGQTRIGGRSPMCNYMAGSYNPGPFVYSDGTNFDYTDWCPGPNAVFPGRQPEPNCHNGSRCVQLITTTADYPTCNNKWDNIECFQVTRYVCKAPAPLSG